LIRRFRLDQDDSQKIAVISIDPSRKRTGGARCWVTASA
jgi:methylmalonyl-CoA mutase